MLMKTKNIVKSDKIRKAKVKSKYFVIGDQKIKIGPNAVKSVKPKAPLTKDILEKTLLGLSKLHYTTPIGEE